VLADIKTFEAMGVYGIAVITCNTHQNDISFKSITWLDKEEKKATIKLLAARFPAKTVKLGIHKNLKDVWHSIKLCKEYFPGAQLVWDPVLTASAGFELDFKVQKKSLEKILSSLSLVTPNQMEVCKLGNSKHADKSAMRLSEHCPTLLKGGHSPDKKTSKDYLYVDGEVKKIYSSERINGKGKHGSGCVLSAAISASLAKGNKLESAIDKGKQYVTNFLKSNNTLLGYHLN